MKGERWRNLLWWLQRCKVSWGGVSTKSGWRGPDKKDAWKLTSQATRTWPGLLSPSCPNTFTKLILQFITAWWQHYLKSWKTFWQTAFVTVLLGLPTGYACWGSRATCPTFRSVGSWRGAGIQLSKEGPLGKPLPGFVTFAWEVQQGCLAKIHPMTLCGLTLLESVILLTKYHQFYSSCPMLGMIAAPTSNLMHGIASTLG